MRSANTFPKLVIGFVAIGSLFASGCASRRYVRNTVSPVDARVSEHDKMIEANKKQIGDLETGLSGANEKAQSAQATADRGVKDAAAANQLATDAGHRADSARESADKSMARAGEVENNINTKFENLQNYKVTATDNVLFKFGSADLTPDAQAKLDTLASGISGKKNFVVEIEGFTDKTGSNQYNLELSQRRADAVARYLTTKHQVPLFAIHMIGMGKDNPVADNKTRDGRSQNRRVEVRMLTPDLTGAATASSMPPSGNTSNTNTNTSTTDSPQK
jgi:outer membrane protein OmpA-like peptidoglycan-associated protein